MKTSNIIFAVKSCLTENVIYALDKDQFETMLESQTYDRFGQPISHCDIGDYITLDTQEIVDYVKQINIIDEFHIRYNTRFSLFDSVSAYEHQLLFNDIIESRYFINGEDYTLHGSTCEAFNYWNGNNWKTHTISKQTGEPSLKVINDKKTIKRLRTAISKRKLVEDTRGIKHYKHGQVELCESAFTNDSWFLFRIKY